MILGNMGCENEQIPGSVNELRVYHGQREESQLQVHDGSIHANPEEYAWIDDRWRPEVQNQASRDQPAVPSATSGKV